MDELHELAYNTSTEHTDTEREGKTAAKLATIQLPQGHADAHSQPYLVLRDTQCSCEAYGMRLITVMSKGKKRTMPVHAAHL